MAVLGMSTVAVAGEVAVVDLQRAVMSTDMARERMKELESQKDYAEALEKAEGLRKELVKMQEEAQKEGPTWTPEQQASFRNDLEFKRKAFELAAQKVQAENQVVFRSINKGMEEKVKDILTQIIEAEKISIVVDKNSTIFASSTIDITDKLTEKLNQLK